VWPRAFAGCLARALRQVAALPLALALVAAQPQAALSQDRLPDLMNLPGLANRAVPPTSSSIALPPSSGPIDPAEYVLGPGDIMQLNLTGSLTRSWDLVVSPDGTLYVPTVGALPAAGLTLLEVRRRAIDKVAVVYKNVVTDVRLVKPRAMVVNLAGQVRLQGPLVVFASSRVSEVLVDTMFAGRASLRNIEVVRRTPQGEQRIPVDLIRFRLTGEHAANILLRDGDVIRVPVSNSRVGIDGAVGRPGDFELARGDSLSTLLALGGGPLAEAQDRAVLMRFRDDTRLDTVFFQVADVVAGRFDLPLQDGDRAYLFFTPHFHQLASATIFGEVARPGVFPVTEGHSRLSDLVTAAGGFLPDANFAALRVFRASPSAGESDPELQRLSGLSRREMTASEYEVLRARTTARREDFRVDWNRAQHDPNLDPLLRAGDVVRVDPVLAAVRVEGEVRRPGIIEFKSSRRVKEYIELAGGYSERANASQVRVTRAVTGQTILARDVSSLAPGDLIWVPERGESQLYQNFMTFMLVAAQIATVFIALRP
jgi:protein involved in polysaccharide export with SLBB domain